MFKILGECLGVEVKDVGAMRVEVISKAHDKADWKDTGLSFDSSWLDQLILALESARLFIDRACIAKDGCHHIKGELRNTPQMNFVIEQTEDPDNGYLFVKGKGKDKSDDGTVKIEMAIRLNNGEWQEVKQLGGSNLVTSISEYMCLEALRDERAYPMLIRDIVNDYVLPIGDCLGNALHKFFRKKSESK